MQLACAAKRARSSATCLHSGAASATTLNLANKLPPGQLGSSGGVSAVLAGAGSTLPGFQGRSAPTPPPAASRTAAAPAHQQ